MRNLLIYLSLLFLLPSYSWAQKKDPTAGLVQFSGVVLTEENSTIIPLPFVNIYIEGTQRGTYSDLDGFFSIVAEKGQTVVFSYLGFETVYYNIPDTLSENRYSVIQLMTKDTILLPETVVYPWPSREHFKIEFLAMDVTDELESRADENLAEKALRELRETVPHDGDETADYYLREQAGKYYYYGQIRPVNLLNPLAWKKFIEAWKRGDFKGTKKN